MRAFLYTFSDRQDDGKRDPKTGTREFVSEWTRTDDAKAGPFTRLLVQGENSDENTTVVVEQSYDGEVVEYTSPNLHDGYNTDVAAPWVRVKVTRKNTPTGRVAIAVRAIA